MPWTVFNSYGQRKYLTSQEIDRFIKEARQFPLEVKAFCWMMSFTGCRISEALSLTRDSIDFGSKQVIIKCLKKRGKKMYRAVPLPNSLLKLLAQWFRSTKGCKDRLWPWSRMTGYRRICEVMAVAGVCGSYASPKGLRHGFGVRAIQANVPLTLVQRWLGHADIKTTAIYTSAMGPEEREIALRMWKGRTSWDKSRKPTKSDRRRKEKDESRHRIFSEELSDYLTPILADGQALSRPFMPFAPRFLRLPPMTGIPQLRHESPRGRSSDCSLIQFWLQCNKKNCCYSSSYISMIDPPPLDTPWLAPRLETAI